MWKAMNPRKKAKSPKGWIFAKGLILNHGEYDGNLRNVEKKVAAPTCLCPHQQMTELQNVVT